jgi:FemAB-related protein (PEP-CTERM system-associated)
MPVIVRPFTPDDSAAWDAFIEAHPHGSVLHLTAWKRSLEATFGYQARYLVAEQGGRIAGVLPLFLVENIVQGRVLISTPFAVYGGIVAATEEARQALAEELRRMGHDLKVQHVDLRNAWPQQCAGFTPVERYATVTQALAPMDGEALQAALPKKTRNLVRKALKSPFETHIRADVEGFYPLLARTYHRLGTPVFAKAHFTRLLAEFGAKADVREIRLEGKVAATSFNFLFKGEMHTYYAASDPDCLALAPNMFLYYDHLLWAAQNGFHTFDFGRSKYETGNLDFKKQWATTVRPLPYEMLLVRRRQLPDFTPRNEKFSLAIQAWRRLPLPLTKIIGPPLVKLFP